MKNEGKVADVGPSPYSAHAGTSMHRVAPLSENIRFCVAFTLRIFEGERFTAFAHLLTPSENIRFYVALTMEKSLKVKDSLHL